jgi:hypothetical protein
MRSLTFKAALAALLVSVPFASAYAASMGSAASTGSTGSTGSAASTASAASRHEPNFGLGDRDRLGDHVRLSDHDSSDTQPLPGYVRGGQLSAVLDELRASDARIASDHKRKLISSAEMRGLRAEEAAIRKAAIADSARDNAMIPNPQYQQLMAQVTNLNAQIDHAARS